MCIFERLPAEVVAGIGVHFWEPAGSSGGRYRCTQFATSQNGVYIGIHFFKWQKKEKCPI